MRRGTPNPIVCCAVDHRTSGRAAKTAMARHVVTILDLEEAVNPTWMTQGSCRGHAPETFFPSDGVGVLRAQRICADCPVQLECLEYALAHNIEHGVWGGASERQRQRIRRAHPQAQPVVRAS